VHAFTVRGTVSTVVQYDYVFGIALIAQEPPVEGRAQFGGSRAVAEFREHALVIE
jgi:hypothetical protein